MCQTVHPQTAPGFESQKIQCDSLSGKAHRTHIQAVVIGQKYDTSARKKMKIDRRDQKRPRPFQDSCGETVDHRQRHHHMTAVPDQGPASLECSMGIPEARQNVPQGDDVIGLFRKLHGQKVAAEYRQSLRGGGRRHARSKLDTFDIENSGRRFHKGSCSGSDIKQAAAYSQPVQPFHPGTGVDANRRCILVGRLLARLVKAGRVNPPQKLPIIPSYRKAVTTTATLHDLIGFLAVEIGGPEPRENHQIGTTANGTPRGHLSHRCTQSHSLSR